MSNKKKRSAEESTTDVAAEREAKHRKVAPHPSPSQNKTPHSLVPLQMENDVWKFEVDSKGWERQVEEAEKRARKASPSNLRRKNDGNNSIYKSKQSTNRKKVESEKAKASKPTNRKMSSFQQGQSSHSEMDEAIMIVESTEPTCLEPPPLTLNSISFEQVKQKLLSGQRVDAAGNIKNARGSGHTIADKYLQRSTSTFLLTMKSVLPASAQSSLFWRMSKSFLTPCGCTTGMASFWPPCTPWMTSEATMVISA